MNETDSESEDDMDTQGVVIEKLPTVGEAYSIKTVKQGRRASLSETVRFQGDLVTAKIAGKTKRVAGRRALRRDGKDTAAANAKRIINFQFATEGQKTAARLFLQDIEEDRWTRLNLIVGITRTLSIKYKEF
jgi:hypothetical protein